jgi:hypothetical protein
MTRNLYRISDQALLPYPRPDDEPVLGLDRTIYRVVAVVQQPAPPYDPTAEQLTSTETYAWLPDGPDSTGLDGTLTRGWAVVPIDPPAPPEPTPDWLGFAGWLYSYPPMAAAMAAARTSTDPQGEPATTGLPSAMDEARLRANYTPFALSWALFLAASGLPPEDAAAIAAHAVSCHLPAEFVAALQPAASSGG